MRLSNLIKQFLFPWAYPPELVATATLLAVGALALSAAATAKSVIDQRKAAKESQKQAALSAREADIQHQQQVREQYRKQRIAAGAITNAAGAAGTSESTGYQGGLGSLETQTSTNVASINTQFGLQTGIGAAAAEKGKYQGQAAEAGAVAGVANQVFDATGGYKNLFAQIPSGGGGSTPLVGTTPGVGYASGGGQ